MPDNRCPTCDSPDPRLHPAVQWEGEVSFCRDAWHAQMPLSDLIDTYRLRFNGLVEWPYAVAERG